MSFSAPPEKLIVLRESLTFFHVDELRNLAIRLTLSDKGAKMAIIMRILCFLQTGNKLLTPKFPESSCAKRGQVYPLEQNTLMLKGCYKNDLKTRLFFKKLLGDHFHFTAFRIDWLNECWMNGNPPTYQEFADMWQCEYRKREAMPSAPKEEWAYIKFMQNHSNIHNNRDSLNIAWENERTKHKNTVESMLKIKI